MKRIMLAFIAIGFALGLFLGIRSHVLNEEEKEVEQVVENHAYIEELNLPLIEVDTLNPVYTNNKQVSDVLKLIYEPLIDINHSNKIVSCLAKNWMERDDLNWLVVIRKNVTWHSGKSLSIDDVIFTINAIKENSSSPYYDNVKNISNVSKIDSDTICITLNEKDELLPYKLTFPIIPEYYFRDALNNQEKNKRPIGTGKYEYIGTSDDEKRITLSFYSNYWEDISPKLKTIYLYNYSTYGEAIKAFKSSEVDVITTSIDFWDRKFGTIGINNYQYENDNFETLIPNCQKISLSEASVRRAILHAINRENIIDEVYNNNASIKDIMIHSCSWLSINDNMAAYDTDKAMQLLTNALWKQTSNGWTKNINGKTATLKFNLMVLKSDEEKVKVAEKIKEDLENIGIRITISKVDNKTYISNINSGNFDLALGTIQTSNDFDLVKLVSTQNYSNYAGNLFENLTLKISNILLKDEFSKLQANYNMEVPYIGLYYKTNMLLTNKAVKGNINPTWWNAYHDIHNWSK